MLNMKNWLPPVLFLGASPIAILFSYIWQNFNKVLFYYKDSLGTEYPYTVGDIVYYSGELAVWFIVILIIKMTIKYWEVPITVKKLCWHYANWWVDRLVIDELYVIYSNPHAKDNSKILSLAIATGVFIFLFFFGDYIKRQISTIWMFFIMKT